MTVTNLKEFNLDLDAFAKKTEITFQTVLKRTALSIFTNIVRRTPVDTGMARASWVIGVNNYAAPANMPEGTQLDGDAATRVSMGRTGALDAAQPYSLVVISNYLPYIQFLENGSSQQAPNGMVRLSIEEEFARMRAVLG